MGDQTKLYNCNIGSLTNFKEFGIFKKFTTSVKLLFIFCMQEDIVVVESIVVDVHQSTRVSVFGNNVYEHLLPKYIHKCGPHFTLYFKSQGLFFDDPLHTQRRHCSTPICSITMCITINSLLELFSMLLCLIFCSLLSFLFQITQLLIKLI